MEKCVHVSYDFIGHTNPFYETLFVRNRSRAKCKLLQNANYFSTIIRKNFVIQPVEQIPSLYFNLRPLAK